MKTVRQVVLALACCAVVLAIVFAILSMRYAASRLVSLRNSPGYASAEIAMQELMIRNHQGTPVEIVADGKDGPGLRYLVARVWPPKVAGSPGKMVSGYGVPIHLLLVLEKLGTP